MILVGPFVSQLTYKVYMVFVRVLVVYHGRSQGKSERSCDHVVSPPTKVDFRLRDYIVPPVAGL